MGEPDTRSRQAVGIVRPCLLALAAALSMHGQQITGVVDPYTGSTNLAPGGLAKITGVAGQPSVTIAGIKATPVVLPVNHPTFIVEIPVTAPVGPANVIVNLSSTVSTAPFPITLTQYAPVLISSTSGTVVSPVHPQSGLPVTQAIPAAPGETGGALRDRTGPDEPG